MQAKPICIFALPVTKHYTHARLQHCFCASDSANSGLQAERLMKRDKCSKELAEAKIASQMPQERKKRKSQYIVDNSDSHSHTTEQACAPLLQFAIQLFS